MQETQTYIEGVKRNARDPTETLTIRNKTTPNLRRIYSMVSVSQGICGKLMEQT